MPKINLRHKIGKWASDKAYVYYKSYGSYKNLPRYLEVLVNWGYKGYGFIDSIRYRWIIR